MNTSHYPSLELCKKLTEIGFPETEFGYSYLKPIWNYEETEIVDYKKGEEPTILGYKYLPEEKYVCPSVMEMLDVFPSETKELGYIEMGKDYVAMVVHDIKDYPTKVIRGTIPNALAEMVVWLYENKYISFSK